MKVTNGIYTIIFLSFVLAGCGGGSADSYSPASK